ncbi:MAG: YggS family pyridoxal phosphate-dependent enzyme [Helicobacteraceae bacterium]|jgi:pyridoxal phosphate enzyme (YggS family)|nr:YggS family pyridoxal phosphate-dependent enzyme [Helicobacteraceae bacterium]
MTRLEAVIDRVEKARLAYDSRHIVRLVAASKYASCERVVALFNEGQRAFGENKVQDFGAKAAALDALAIEWHFIGALQSNKINKLIALRPALIHSIDSLELAKVCDERLAKAGLTQRALLQINSAKEPTKSGVAPEAAADIYAEIASTCRALTLEGVMTIGAHTSDEKTIQNSFETTRRIYDRINGAKTLSMGMSGDFELAIACGANLLRLGAILFEP